MQFFDRNPQLFRVLLGIVTLILVFFVGSWIYQFGTATTDENWFKEAPSRLCIIHGLPTQNIGRPSARDSILAGDILYAVGGVKVQRLSALLPLLRTKPSGEVRIDVFRPSINRNFSPTVRWENLDTTVVRELPPFAAVIDVTPGGGSDRAGMKPGDLIVRINGRGFNTVAEADRIMSEAQAGRTLQYEIFRDDKLLTLDVTLARFGLSLAFLVMLLNALYWMATGLYLGMRRPGIAGARLLGAWFLTVGACFSIAFVRPEVGNAFPLRSSLVRAGLLFAFPLFLHVWHYFPGDWGALLARPWIRRGGYLLATALVVTGFLWRGAPYVMGVLILGLYVLAVAFVFRKTCPPEYKAIARPVRWVGLATGVLSVLVTIYAGITSAGGAWIKSGYMGLPLAFFPSVILYVIGKHRLLDMEIRVRRTLQYGVAATAWRIATFAVYLSLIYLLAGWRPQIPAFRLSGASIELLDGPASPGEAEIVRTVTIVLAAVVLTLLFSKIGRVGLDAIARRFHRTRYDYRRAAAELAEAMATRLTMTDLARGIVEKLGALMQLKRVGVLFFRNERACCCQEVHGFDGKEWNAFCLQAGGDIALALGTFSGEIRSEYLPTRLKEEFLRSGFVTVFPVRSKEKLIGAILVGEKESEAAFGAEDFEFLTATANQASIAIENAFLYEELAEKERLKHELAIARKIQVDSLPQKTPTVPGLEVAGISIPALEVGGDYYDYLNGSLNQLTVIVGDVSGKGTSAALYMSRLQGIFRSLHEFGLAPRELLVRANRLLYGEMDRKSFVTAVSALFETDACRVTLARAGHPPLLRFRPRTSTVERILPRGMGLGMQDSRIFDAEVEESVIPYESGDVFLFVTDGITEARSPLGELFGEQALVEILRAAKNASADDLRNRVISAVSAFTAGAGQLDDQTVVVVRVLPQG